MTEREDLEALAAEHVLGTLDSSERAAVAARCKREAPLRLAIEAWEQRLGPLSALGPSITPPADLFNKISARLEPIVKSAVDHQRIVNLETRVQRWRGISGAISAIAASLVIAVGVREYARPPQPSGSYFAVFQQGDVAPEFVMTIDLERRVLSVRPVSASAPIGKTYQLWIVATETGGVPKSLGLVDKDALATQALLSAFDPLNLKNATFGVSLEPEGGSPTGKPTGPALHSKLFPSQM